MLRRVAVAIAILVLVSGPTAAVAQERDAPADQVMLSGDVAIPRGTIVGEVVVFSGSATVAGVAEGDIVVLDGAVTVSGQVSGDVVALHGPIRLLGTAQVAGDVLAGGTLTVADGAQVAGSVRHDVAFTLSRPVTALGALVVSIAMSVSILLLGLLLLLLAPRGVERTSEALRNSPAAVAGWGLVLAVGLPVASVALAVTILGLPLGLALLLALGLVWLLGHTVLTFGVGRLVVRPPRSRLAALLAGWAIGAAVGLVPFLNVIWWSLGGVAGLGAILVSVWRARGGHAPVPGGTRPGRHRARGARPEPLRPPAIPAPATVAGDERPADMPLAED